MDQDDGLLEDSIEIQAAPVQVWALVTDPARMASWSPQVVRSVVPRRPVRQGTRFLNLNRRGLLLWPTQAQVVEFEPHRRFAYRIVENRAVWSFTLASTGPASTRLTQRRETPDGLSPASIGLTRAALGGRATFTEELRQGMRQTLERIKQEAEA